MNELLKNVKANPKTTNAGVGVGLAVVVISVLKMFKVDLGDISGVNSEYVVLGLSSLVSAVVNLFARDPEKKNAKDKKDIQ